MPSLTGTRRGRTPSAAAKPRLGRHGAPRVVAVNTHHLPGPPQDRLHMLCRLLRIFCADPAGTGFTSPPNHIYVHPHESNQSAIEWRSDHAAAAPGAPARPRNPRPRLAAVVWFGPHRTIRRDRSAQDMAVRRAAVVVESGRRWQRIHDGFRRRRESLYRG